MLEGKVIAITGASRGIGRALALGLAQEGARLALCARSLEPLEGLKKEILTVTSNRPDSVFIDRCDIANSQEAAAWVDGAANFFGRIDVLINNAGVLGARLQIADYPEDVWRQAMDINVNGTFYVTKAVLNRAMLKSAPGESIGDGVIINVSSGVGRVGKPQWGAYALSKFAMEGFTQVLANELRDNGIRVFAINPEPTRSQMRAEAYPQEDPNTLKTPESLTKVFIRLINEMGLKDSGKSFAYSELA